MKSLSYRALQRFPVVAFAVAILAGAARLTIAAPTNVAVRDPSTLVKKDGLYWVVGTGRGAPQFSSTDARQWTPRGPALPQTPAWVKNAVPENRDNSIWAPDIAFFGGQYRLYYVYSTIGSKQSAIGLATNATLDPQGWTDRGIVIQSGPNTGYNALDPSVFEDAQGHWWLAFGSYFDGLFVTSLDKNSGKRLESGAVTPIATRPDVAGNPIEAPAITFHDGWYYLFVNWDFCLVGAKSTYNIRVGRSREVTGPYRDKNEQLLGRGGGTLFLGSVVDDGSGRPFDDQVGPGHAGILRQGENFLLSTHYEWSRFNKGATTMNVGALAWDSDGWPRAVLDAGPFKIVSNLGTRGVLETQGRAVQTNAYEARAGQKWVLTHRGDGFYTLGSPDSLVLGTVGGASTPGTLVEMAPFRNADSQKWLARQNEDGTYTLLLKSGGQKVALDVAGGSMNDESPIQVWSDLFNDAQKWTFHAR